MSCREDVSWKIDYNLLVASFTGMLHGAYHGIGHGLGRVAGGLLFSTLGAQATFFIFGCLGIIMLIMFVAVNKVFQGVKTK